LGEEICVGGHTLKERDDCRYPDIHCGRLVQQSL
jgi:hypothetical protein